MDLHKPERLRNSRLSFTCFNASTRQEHISSFARRTNRREILQTTPRTTSTTGTTQTIMASSWATICLTILCFSAQLAWAQEPTTYSVGDGAGWTYINVSSGQPADYPGWAAKYQFFVNDVLRFNYEPTKENIYLFPNKEDWESCDLANGKLLDDGTSGSSEWILSIEAYYNFASGINCDKGQKFRILAVKNVGTGGIEAPIPAPSPSKRAPVRGPSTAPASEPSTVPSSSPSNSPVRAKAPASPISASAPAPAFAPAPPASASPPATWIQTLILAAAGVTAATMLKL